MVLIAPDVQGAIFGTDLSPKVSIEITGASGTVEYNAVKEYSYDSDVLQLGDPFCVSLANPDGTISQKIKPGDTVKYFISDPAVQGGAKVQKLTGIVTGLRYSGNGHAGDVVNVTGADLGWHLNNNCARLWQRYRGWKWDALTKSLLDPSWGFVFPIRFDNEANKAIKLGRAVIPALTAGNLSILPPIQFEPGQMVSDVLIPLAKRDKVLINVSADGRLQVFRPGVNKQILYRFHNHGSTEYDRRKNNVIDYQHESKIDGLYTHVTCVGQVAYVGKNAGTGQPTADHPNEGKVRGDIFTTSTGLRFTRYYSFADSDQFIRANAENRAVWKAQRGEFDSWTLTYTVQGHSQNGFFYEPDTFCEVSDTVLGISGTYYVSAVRYNRTQGTGTRTQLTIKKPNLLGA